MDRGVIHEPRGQSINSIEFFRENNMFHYLASTTPFTAYYHEPALFQQLNCSPQLLESLDNYLSLMLGSPIFFRQTLRRQHIAVTEMVEVI